MKRSHSEASGNYNRARWFKEIDWLPSTLYKNLNKPEQTKSKAEEKKGNEEPLYSDTEVAYLASVFKLKVEKSKSAPMAELQGI